MKKRFFSILLCFCMVLGLLPATALAEGYDGWEAATAEGVTLTADTDTVTIAGTPYTYKGEADTSGISMVSFEDANTIALKQACCWKAGNGYVLYNPTVATDPYARSVDYTTSAEVTLHNAQISTTSTSNADALRLPFNRFSSNDPLPVVWYQSQEL